MKTKITFLLIFLMSISILGQTHNIAAFSGTFFPEVKTAANVIATPLKRGSGLNAALSPTFNSGDWTTSHTPDANDYIEWTLSATPGYKVNITGLQINYSIGPDKKILAFLFGSGPSSVKLKASLNGFSSEIYTNDKVSIEGQSPIISTKLTLTAGETITFRLYGYKTYPGAFGYNLGTLAIEGGLNTVLGQKNTGIRIMGTVEPDGLLFTGGQWSPKAPTALTSDLNAIILNGTYTEANNVQFKNVTVTPGAGIVVKNTGSITVNGNLITADNVTLQSSSTQYSSLIVKGNVTGTTNYQRHVNLRAAAGSTTGGNDLVSAPVTGETFDAFRAANPNIYSNSTNTKFLFGPFNKETGAYVTYSDTETAPLTPGTGYRAASTNNDYFTFTGTVNTAEVIKPITHSGPYYKQWNLIGNPYPSYIKLSDFLAANNAEFSTLSAGIYGYDGDESDGWEIWNLAYLTRNPDAKIAPGQGFLVTSKLGGGSVKFTPEMRSAGATDDFIAGRNQSTDRVGFLKLKISSNERQYHTDFYFNDMSTKGLDLGYDASIYGGTAPAFSIYSKLLDTNGGVDMAVQSLSYTDLENEVIIPLGLKAAAGQQVSVSIAESILPEGMDVYLEDNLTHTFTLLNTADYVFTSDSKANTPGRFFLRFNNTTLSNADTAFDSLQIFTSTASRAVVVKGQIQANTVVAIYDLQGRLMSSGKLNESTTHNQVDLSQMSTGVYIVTLKNNSQEKTQKVILK